MGKLCQLWVQSTGIISGTLEAPVVLSSLRRRKDIRVQQAEASRDADRRMILNSKLGTTPPAGTQRAQHGLIKEYT